MSTTGRDAANSPQSVDPTRSVTLRKKFRGDMNGRLRDVRGAVREYVQGVNQDAPGYRLLRSFRTWFSPELSDAFVEPTQPKTAERGMHWTGTYVRQAYDKGLRIARSDLNALDTVDDEQVSKATKIARPEHNHARRREYLTAYYGVEDIAGRLEQHATQTVESMLRRELGARATADAVTEEMRARSNESVTAMANTVVVETVNEALLTSFRLAENVNGVGMIPEAQPAPQPDDGSRQNAARANSEGELMWQTAGDEDVCDECNAIAGTFVYISQIQNKAQFQPPLHPNCRCRLVPTTMEDEHELLATTGWTPTDVTSVSGQHPGMTVVAPYGIEGVPGAEVFEWDAMEKLWRSVERPDLTVSPGGLNN